MAPGKELSSDSRPMLPAIRASPSSDSGPRRKGCRTAGNAPNASREPSSSSQTRVGAMKKAAAGERCTIQTLKANDAKANPATKATPAPRRSRCKTTSSSGRPI